MNQKNKSSIVSKVIFIVIFLCLGIVIAVSGLKIYQIRSEYRMADEVSNQLKIYKPTFNATLEPEDSLEENLTLASLNQEYSDVVGWITIDNTNIDYLFVQGEDNFQYLRSTLDGDYLVSGTVFLDYRSARDFSDFNSILYGHLMNNGTMFSDIEKFQSKEYFDQHPTGTLFLLDKAYRLEIFSYLVVDSNDQNIYQPNTYTDEFIPYVKSHALHYKDIPIEPDDRLVTLSTCSNIDQEYRSVLVAKLVEIEQ